MIKIEPITRQEQFYNAILDEGDAPIPITREEKYLAKIAGEDVDVPDPITRKERFLNEIIEHGGGITPTGTIDITENGAVDVTEYAEANVNVQPTLEEKTLTLGASSPSTVSPDSGYDGLSSVPITIDNTVIKAENIAEGATILGIAGTHSGGGGQIPVHGVFFIDYDGSIVTAWASDDVASKTALPDNPTHDGLVAQGWNWSLANIKSHIANYQSADVFVGQMYETASGLTEIDITVTKATGLNVVCKMSGNKDWGDGTTDSKTSHTYDNYGDYTITCNGTSIPAGTSSAGGMFGSSSSNMNRYWCTAIRIGGNVTRIGDYAFYYCCSLTNITIPDGVTSIGNSAFYECCSLTNITIPESVTSIGSSAFYDCYSLTNVAIPGSVTSIGIYAFYCCFSLTNITIPDGVTSIGDSAFYYCISLTNITIPESVTSIGASVFRSCYSLTNVAIHGSVTRIGDYAFYLCYLLTNITIPESVTSIGIYAFYDCLSLTNITIPESVTSIGNSAFYECYILINYDFSTLDAIPALSNTNAFSGINGICKIIVPDALYDSWITATNWSSYANYIYKASEV